MPEVIIVSNITIASLEIVLLTTLPPHPTGWAATLNTAERERWLKPSEAADLFEQAGLWRPARSTFCKWAAARGMNFLRSPGNQRRYAESDVRALIAEISGVAA